MNMRERNEMLEYRLTDALEMNYSKNRQALRIIKRKLLRDRVKDPNLYPLPSFVLEGALVVIQNGDSKRVKELYLLDARKESFRTFRIKLIS